MKGIMLRGQRPKPQGLACQLCQFSTSSGPPRALFRRQLTPANPTNNAVHLGQLRSKRTLKIPLASPLYTIGRYAPNSSKTSSRIDPDSTLKQLEEELSQIQNSATVPSERAVVQLLQKCQDIAAVIMQPEKGQEENSQEVEKDDNAISSLLDLDEKDAGKKSPPTKRPESSFGESLSRIANTLLADEKVFISPKALACYTKMHSHLKKAEDFPEIFYMYAHKPVPEANSSPIKYLKPKPKSINNAVPADLANMALDIAIEQRNLQLVLDIIDTTFNTPAFRRAKVLKKGGLPIAGVATMPIACYGIASYLSTLQNVMDPSTATAISYGAVLTYAGVSSSFGILALLTFNDQMERVVWLLGTPLRQRWVREEERAAFDKVAMAWGFKDVYKRGEEEGEDWENLREVIGMRGMILDKTELMPGME
ncbi:hypothetical protein PHISCL_07280 [Aspergillus sclerotialis]|uniref:Uncharacterized protein n=1 Tax=Aspergillus sclerotialis TaxID=2070753 RepID=A0A3A2ZLZ9_9EURO|nr:hypothetical protein PHISCL_07280 [Aspergillus sclerotialis]